MKAMIHLRSFAVVALAAMALSVFAQSEVRVNKVLRAQKMDGKTVLKASDARLPQNVVEFDHEVDINSLPQEVRDFLSSYEEALRRIDNGEDAASVLSIDRSHSAMTTDSVGPILGAIEFDQGTPYNNHCPIINSARAITGCVATAMSEIMAYWKYPAVGTGSTTYTGSRGAETFNFAEHPFDWNNILPTYRPGNYTTAQADAVAELHLACGASVNMNYTANASGANSSKVLPALRDYFGYDPKIEYLHDATDDLIQLVWVPCLIDEFNQNRPVYYAGSTQTSGHAFVMDGYKYEGDVVKFHVNWGWNGSYNGWFLITRLQPQAENYSAYSNDLIINIFPPGLGIENTNADAAQKIDVNAPVYTILGTKIPATSMQRGMIYIQNGRKFVW